MKIRARDGSTEYPRSTQRLPHVYPTSTGRLPNVYPTSAQRLPNVFRIPPSHAQLMMVHRFTVEEMTLARGFS